MSEKANFLQICIFKAFDQFCRKSVNIKISVIKNTYLLQKTSIAKRTLGLCISLIDLSTRRNVGQTPFWIVMDKCVHNVSFENTLTAAALLAVFLINLLWTMFLSISWSKIMNFFGIVGEPAFCNIVHNKKKHAFLHVFHLSPFPPIF